MDLSRFGQINQSLNDSPRVDCSSNTNNTNPTQSSASSDNDEGPELVYQSNNTAIYRFNDKGIKAVVDPNPSEEQILQLVHEHNISQFLPPTCRKRNVLDVKGFRGDPAITFQWARDKTLAEWLLIARRRSTGGNGVQQHHQQQQQQQASVDLNVRLRAAIAITETLNDFHTAGVIYNSLSPTNIVLDTFDGAYVATLIDLSEATIHHDKDEDFTTKVMEGDLKCLGSILTKLFDADSSDNEMEQQEETSSQNQSLTSSNSGFWQVGAAAAAEAEVNDTPLEETKEEPSTRKRVRQQSLGEGLPMYLGTLISTLLTSSQIRYRSAKDVLLDLRVVEKKPEVFLKRPVLDDFLVRGRLQLPADAFYGRQSEISILLHALSSLTKSGGQPTMVSISGLPGTGKTSLVNQIKKPLKDANGHFVHAKFDVRAGSDSVIFLALDTFFSKMSRQGVNNQELRSRIFKSLGSGCRILMKSIPSLKVFMEENDEENTEISFGPAAPEQRWKALLCKLIAATSGETCPLAIFLDDLQWADEVSLDVIQMLITDPDIRYCLFVMAHRDDQSNSAKRLKKLLYGMQDQGVSLMSIKIGAIEKDSVNTLLSETLCLPPRLCNPLSAAIHNKTGGIALFVNRFLKSLNDEGLLWFNLSCRRWEFDVRGIEQKEISEDVVQHTSERMIRLPHGMQSGLKLAACLGSSFDARTLEKGVLEVSEDINEFLRFAVEGGYLRGDATSGVYRWGHDQIQQAAYELIPEAKRESFHLLLGSRIFLRTTPDELDKDLFTIVGNMNIGVRLIKSQGQKLEIARLNLRAGERAMASSSFDSAAKYLMLGVTLLPDDSWGGDYDLTIRLYDAALEALYVTGDFDTLSDIIQIPLFRARSFEDKLNTYRILVKFLISSGQLKEGISKCTSLLRELGEPIPEHVTNEVYAEEVQHVRQALQDLSVDDLLALPLMTDERKIICIQFMNHAVNAAYCVEPLLAPILVFRMVRLSIDHGVCNISAFAFGCYGTWLVSAINSDFDGGHRMGRLAIDLMNRLDAKEFIPRVYTSVYAFINIWKEPFQAGLEKHLEAYDAGALSGDMDYAISCLFQYATCALNSCGEELGMLEKRIRLYIRRAIQFRQILPARSLVCLHEQCLLLMGSRESSYSTFFDTREDIIYQECLQKNETSVCRYILHKRKLVSFFYGDMEAAAEFFEMGSEYPSGANGRLSHISLGVVIDGLIAFYFARKHREDECRWTNIGEAVMDLTRHWAKNSEWNFINKLYLLEAEVFFLRNDESKALEKYEQSIKAARDHHFIHEEGLAFERAASFHLQCGRKGEALACYTQAKKCYQSWGANGIVCCLERTIQNL